LFPAREYFPGKNAYQILTVSRDACAKDIKTAHRKLISQHHPNKFLAHGDEVVREYEKKLVVFDKAFYCLANDERRIRYNEFLDSKVTTTE
jgi:DnaJ-class molecular chaperone